MNRAECAVTQSAQRARGAWRACRGLSQAQAERWSRQLKALIASLSTYALIAMATAASAAPGSASEEEPPQSTATFLAAAPRCASPDLRLSLRTHIVYRGGEPVVSPAWLREQLQEANRLFRPLKLCFQLTEVQELPAALWRVRSRSMRSSIGLPRRLRGAIDLFVIGRLDDVDIAGEEIRGVHWRHPRDRERLRWIFLSRIAAAKVLAHELGHYFDLPHSTAPQSIMNKTPRATPPPAARGFTRSEYQRMRRAWRRMRGSGHLQVLAPPSLEE